MQEVQTTLSIGSVIRGRYVIESLLGKGGFGAVYRVQDQRVKGNLYALKEVIEPNRKDRTRKDRNRFIFEGDILKRLDHRALPRVYRVFEDDTHERAYMLMDYIDGPNLDTLRQQQPEKRFSLSQVMTIMAPVIDAVHYLHSQQPPIIHRDIKPANIIAPTPNDAVLVDFDIAKEFDPDSTTTAVRRCSPGYGAPEQYGQGTSTRTDIYGLGATIYTLLTGIVPPDALHRMTILGAKGHDPLLPVNQIVPDVPKNVAEAIQNAMSIHAIDRFSTVEQFWQTFDTYSTMHEMPVPLETVFPSSSSQLPTAAKNASTTVPTKKLSPISVTQPRRRKAFFALLALFVVLGSAAALWALFSNHKGVLSVTPALYPQHTVSVTISPSPDPTIISKSSGGSGKVVPTLSPTAPSSTPVPSQSSPTPASSSSPTATPTPQPTPRPTPTPTPRPTPTPTPTPNPYPILASSYNGTIVDTTPSPNITTGMYLSSIHQYKGSISGVFTVDQPLQGNGPFTGTVGTNKYVQFTIKGYNGHAPLYFWGFVQSNQSLQGQYCSLDQNGHCSANVGAGGYWNVAPGPPGS